MSAEYLNAYIVAGINELYISCNYFEVSNYRVNLLLINLADVLGSLITSQTRIKLLIKFFLNSNTKAYLRGLESEFRESSNGIRIELNRFEKAGLLNSFHEGNKKIYQANSEHPLFNDIHNLILKETGIDRVIDKVIHRLGKLVSIYLTGDLAKGKDCKTIDLIIVGDEIDKEYLARKINQAEDLVGRKVTFKILCAADAKEQQGLFNSSDFFLIWSNGLS